MACIARAISRNLLPQIAVRQPVTSCHIKYVAVGSDRAVRDAPCYRSTLPAQTNKSLTHSTCVRCDPGSWRASSCHAQCSLHYGGESTERGRSLLCTSALPRADPPQIHRAVDAGRARAVICGTNEQQALSAVAAAHGIESASRRTCAWSWSASDVAPRLTCGTGKADGRAGVTTVDWHELWSCQHTCAALLQQCCDRR